MRIQGILVGIYFLVAVIFLAVNPDYARAPFHVNLIFEKYEVAIMPIIFFLSLVWMLLIMFVNYVATNSLKKQIMKLKAQVHDSEKSELLKLLKEINEKIDGHSTTVYQQLNEIEEILKGKKNAEKDHGF